MSIFQTWLITNKIHFYGDLLAPLNIIDGSLKKSFRFIHTVMVLDILIILMGYRLSDFEKQLNRFKNKMKVFTRLIFF